MKQHWFTAELNKSQNR